MMMRASFVAAVVIAACAGPAKEDSKGQVDESEPPAIPPAAGKQDASSKVVAVDVQSAHPYANHTDRVFDVPLASTLPSCAERARLHFKVLRTEPNYDFVTVVPTGEQLTGIHDDTWTEWFAITSASARVRLESDYSITRHGFEIDAVEWNGLPDHCAAVPLGPCPNDGSVVDLAQVPGTCECPVAPQCEPIDNIEVAHQLALGFNNTTKTAHGAVARYTRPGPADGPETHTIGSIDPTALAQLVRRAAVLGLLHGPGYTEPVAAGVFYERFRIKAGSLDVSFVASQGAHTAQVRSLIDEFEALFTCGGGGLTCGGGYVCEQGQCIVDQSCICPALYQPVCGTNGVTYGNGCELGCANVGEAHAGECGIAGDTCGTIMGLGCQDDYRCRFAPGVFDTSPWADAGGTCVARNYCDAPPDCAGLPHIAVPGAWACTNNTCAWQAGPVWQTLNHFETPSPYANNTSVWHQVYLPSGGQVMRLRTLRFRTEYSYDKLEVWTWRNGSWAKVRTYTGSAGPELTDEFTGQYHYLKFVSDSSVTATGVSVDVEYR